MSTTPAPCGPFARRSRSARTAATSWSASAWKGACCTSWTPRDGYYLPKEGATNFALALIDFASLSHYEEYRKRLAADPDAKRNLADAKQSRCILVESRSFLRRV